MAQRRRTKSDKGDSKATISPTTQYYGSYLPSSDGPGYVPDSPLFGPGQPPAFTPAELAAGLNTPILAPSNSYKHHLDALLQALKNSNAKGTDF